MADQIARAESGEAWLVPDWPAPANVVAASTLRQGGYSPVPFDGWNLAAHVGDKPENVLRNRAVLRDVMGLAHEPVWLEQVHGRQVLAAHEIPPGQAPAADGSWTNQPGVACIAMTADCLPVLFCDRDGSCVAAAHAGWRGLHAGVLEAAVASMSVAPSNIMAWLGPAIGSQQFQVGEEVRAAFMEHDDRHSEGFVHQYDDKWLADIYRLAWQRLESCGVSTIYGGGLCTYTDQDRFFSYRRASVTGRMASLIYLRP